MKRYQTKVISQFKSVIPSNIESHSLVDKTQRIYRYIAQQRMVGLVQDIGFTGIGLDPKEVVMPTGEPIRLWPESYNRFILFSMLTKLTRGSLLFYGDAGVGKTSMAAMMALITGRQYKDIIREIVQGQPHLTLSDLIADLNLAKYSQGIVEPIFHPRIKHKHADLIFDELSQMPPRVQAALLSLMSGYVERFGVVVDLHERSIFATLNGLSGGAAFEIMPPLLDRFDVAVVGYPRNNIYSGTITPDNSLPFPKELRMTEAEISKIQVQMSRLPLSSDAELRFSYFLSLLNTSSNAALSPEHQFKSHIAPSGLRASATHDRHAHDDSSTTLSSLLEGTVSDRFMRSVIKFSRALAWFRGKTQVDTEDIAQVIGPASLHRFIPSPFFMNIAPVYRHDAEARSRYLWEKAMDKYDDRFPDRFELSFQAKNFPEFYSDQEFAQAPLFRGYWELRESLDLLPSRAIKLAAITKSMQYFASDVIEGSEGVEELLAMQILFHQYVDEQLATVESKQISGLRKNSSSSTVSRQPIRAEDVAGMSYVTFKAAKLVRLGAKSQERNPEHMVNLSAFKMSRSPVTQDMFELIMGYNPSHFRAVTTGSHPVENLKREEAILYCQKLSLLANDLADAIKQQIQDLSPDAYLLYVFSHRGQGLFRLPTEAEWEYAAKSADDDYWYGLNSNRTTHSVKEGKPNERGLNMRGNVWQWCMDNWSERLSPTQLMDPVHLSSETNFVIRGGSWSDNHESSFDPACRYWHDARTASNAVGFRVVRT